MLSEAEPMTDTYSTYEAKAKFSEILRKVREGKHVLITYRGKEVAEIKPIEEKQKTLEEKLQELEARGLITRAVNPNAPLNPIAKRPGALNRFLEERE